MNIFIRFIFVFFLLSFFAKAAAIPVKVAGARHVLVLFSDGTVAGWGACEAGELGPISEIQRSGNYSAKLIKIKLPRMAVDIAAGESSSFAVLDDGSVMAWGSNRNYMLGYAPETGKLNLPDGTSGSEVPVAIGNLSNVVKIAAGSHYAAALQRDGTVLVWGKSVAENLGDGKSPVKLAGVKDITDISASNTHIMALDKSGRVWTFGGNLYGQLGRDNNLKNVNQIAGLTDIVSIAAGYGVSTVLKKDGTVWVWGSNFNGQFGNGDRTNAPVPGGLSNKISLAAQQVPNIKNVVRISSGILGRHTLVLLKDGTLRGWGNTDWGQIGAGVFGTFQVSPVTPKISNVVAVFAVHSGSFAITADNSFWIWGEGRRGGFPLSSNATFPTKLAF